MLAEEFADGAALEADGGTFQPARWGRGVLTISAGLFSFTIAKQSSVRWGDGGCESMRRIRCRICFKAT